MKPLRQPKTLTCGSIKFRRISEWNQVDAAISEGPFYARVGVKEPGTVYLPDAEYLFTTNIRQPRHMIRIKLNSTE